MTRAALPLAGGGALVAGLVWDIRRRRTLPRRGPAGLRLRHGARQAHGRSARAGETSLLLALAAGLLAGTAVARGTWAFAATLPDGRGWSGLAEIGSGAEERIQPMPGPERLHPDTPSLRAALAEEAAVTGLAGVAGHRDDTRLLASLRRVFPDLDVRAVGPAPGGLPVFAPARRVPAHLAAAALAAAVLLAGGLTMAPLVAAALRPPPPPPPRMVAVGPDPAAFAPLCIAALGSWWPRVAGWEPRGSGCALGERRPAAMPPPETAPDGVPVTVWLEARLTGDVNAVLAGLSAAQLLETWPHGSLVSDGRMLLWQERRIDLVRQDGRPAPEMSDRTVEALAVAFAHAPGAVRRTEDGITVTAPGGAADLLGRASRATGLMPVRLWLPATGDAALELVRPERRRVPEAEAPPPDPRKGGE